MDRHRVRPWSLLLSPDPAPWGSKSTARTPLVVPSRAGPRPKVRISSSGSGALFRRYVLEGQAGGGHAVVVGRFHQSQRLGPKLAHHADGVPELARVSVEGLVQQVEEETV